MEGKVLTRAQLEILRDNNAIRGCTLRPAGDKWTLFVVASGGERQVTKQRSKEPRMFRSLDTACLFVKELGLGLVTIETARWVPRQKQLAVTSKAIVGRTLTQFARTRGERNESTSGS